MLKLNYIKNVINKYDYIMEDKTIEGLLVYRDSFEPKIEESSISLCPSLDRLKLYRSLSYPSVAYEEIKFDLDSIDKLEYNKKNKYKKELKSKKFSLNLRFLGSDTKNEYCYSIIFENEKLLELKHFWTGILSIVHKNLVKKP
ncbi:hypothetical protein KQ875_00275 [Mycoplasma zalophi]|uniref:Uncharacterized protein n=1 Tax=Mycoplasma zalophi TaxID=191287 RepID=A0ABS6DNY6_9MOLU|nr:hypothetical protein [Mycoplasma zalophi]MBU4692034.1 hypothetical protein [Mycoplasma zalophi]